MGNVKEYIFRNKHFKEDEDIRNFFIELNKKYIDTYHSYQDVRIYLPTDIDNMVVKYGNMLRGFILARDYQTIQNFSEEIAHKEKEIVSLVQNFLSLK